MSISQNGNPQGALGTALPAEAGPPQLDPASQPAQAECESGEPWVAKPITHTRGRQKGLVSF